MKTKLLLFLLLFTPATVYTQEQQTPTSIQTENFYYAGKIWGFVKQYHPEARQGKFDMDSLLVVLLDNVAEVKDTKQRNAILSSWIAQFGKIKEFEKFVIKDSSQYKQLYNYSWLEDKSFDKKLSHSLTDIKNAKRTDTCYYAALNAISVPSFENEKEIIPDFSKRHQKLTFLFRYWNTIEYYFPYKYLTDKKWDDVLKEYIPQFVEVENISEFDFAIRLLTTEINDGHSIYLSEKGLNVRYPYKKYRSPIRFVYAKDKFLVSGLWYYMKNSGRVSDYGMELGDELVAVNGRDPKEIMKNEISNYYGTSNFNLLCNNNNDFLLQSNTTSMEVTYRRSGELFTDSIKIAPLEYLPCYPIPNETISVKDSIAYVNLPFVKREELFEMIHKIQKTKGAVLDMRGYPDPYMIYDIAAFFSSEDRSFVKTSRIIPQNPGNFKFSDSNNSGYLQMNYYKGKIVVLVDYSTVSSSEYNTMRMQSIPGVITIGSQTAGSDGNITYIPLRNDLQFGFSSLGIYYPDGGETQRVGVRIDEEVYPTPQGLKEGRDEVVERAIKIINAQ